MARMVDVDIGIGISCAITCRNSNVQLYKTSRAQSAWFFRLLDSLSYNDAWAVRDTQSGEVHIEWG